MNTDKFYLVKKEIERVFKESDCADPFDREKDPIHSKLTLEWVLELKPDADEILQIAALGHDVDRAIEKRRVKKENFKDYKEYKKTHSRASAEIMCEIMKKCGFEENLVEKVRFLVENHEIGGSKETDILREADSLTFFNWDIYYYLENNGAEKTKEKIKFMYKRLSEKAKKLVCRIEFKNKEVGSLFKEAASEI